MKLLQIATFMIFFIIAIKIEKIQSESEEESNNVDRVKRSFIPYRTGKKVASQVSNALDHLLFFSGYDKRIRPQVRTFLVFRERCRAGSLFYFNDASKHVLEAESPYNHSNYVQGIS